ncbi:MAG: CRISPR-associated endonuclease Cas2 [Anaerolineae bacterium]
MGKQFILVVYDISSNKRRTKLHNRLKDFGSPVQYSVFECLLNGEETTAMKRAVQKIIKPRLDRVRYYPMCNRCLKGIEITSGPEALHHTDVTIV